MKRFVAFLMAGLLTLSDPAGIYAADFTDGAAPLEDILIWDDGSQEGDAGEETAGNPAADIPAEEDMLSEEPVSGGAESEDAVFGETDFQEDLDIPAADEGELPEEELPEAELPEAELPAEELSEILLTEESSGEPGQTETEQADADAELSGEIEIQEEEDAVIEETEVFEETAVLEASGEKINLYAIDEFYQSYLSITDTALYPQSYDLGGRQAKIVSGESVVIENGAVKPKQEIWYYHEDDSGFQVGSSNPSGAEGEYVVKKYHYGDAVVQLDGKDTVTFSVIDYAQLYSQSVMDQYLAAHITAGMTEYQKAEVCCKFVAENYSYGVESTSSTGMIITGSGDCWASTDALLYMMEKLGISCTSRDASHEPGAGSGHVNVIAKLDGKYCIVDAGYVGTAPRFYSIEEYASPFAYRKLTSTTAEIYSFVNLDGWTEVVIPETIAGFTVTKIGSGAFIGQKEVISYSIPDTVTEIGDWAFRENSALKRIEIPEGVVSLGTGCFYEDRSLESVSLPASLRELGDRAFLNCFVLSDIRIAPGNEYFTVQDCVLYDKSMETLLHCSGGKRDDVFRVPDSVKTLGPWSMINSWAKELILPDGLQEIGSYAFTLNNRALRRLVLPDSLTKISAYAFYSSTFGEVVLPKNLKEIEAHTFERSNIEKINFPRGLEYVGDYAFAGSYFLQRTWLPASVKEIGAYAFALDYGWSSMDATSPQGSYKLYMGVDGACSPKIGTNAFSGVVLGVVSGSPLHQYAEANSSPYVLLNANNRISMDESWLLPQIKYVYMGQETEASVEWRSSSVPFRLEEGLDYEIRCSDNLFPGTAKVEITGIGCLEGTLYQTFLIEKNKDYEITSSSMADGMHLSWKAPGKDVNYEIFRREEGQKDYVKVGTAASPAWTDVDVASGRSYEYLIHACFAAGNYKTFLSAEAYYLSSPVLSAPENVSDGIRLTWKTVKGASAYRVYYRTVGESRWSKSEVRAEDGAAEASCVKYASSGKTYEFYVAAFHGTFDGAPSEVRSFLALSGPLVSANNTLFGVRLQWNRTTGAENYDIYRKEKGGSAYKKVKNVSSSVWIDTGVKKGKTYLYKVRAVNGSSRSAFFDEEEIVYKMNESDLAAGVLQGGVRLSWKKPDEISSFEIYRKKRGEASYQKAGESSGTEWEDIDVKNNTQYTYLLKASVDGKKVSAPARTVWYLDAPVLVSVGKSRYSAKIQNVTITWKTVAGADSYRVYCRPVGSDAWQRSYSVTAKKGTVMKDSVLLSSDENSEFWVTACRGGNESAPSATGVPGKAVKALLAAPTISKAANTSSGVKLTWKKSSGAKGYYIYRKNSKSVWQKIATVKGGTKTAYTDQGVKKKNAVTYYYIVRAYNNSGASSSSKTTKIFRLETPSVSKLKNSGARKLTVTWKKNAKASGYQIQYSLKKDFTGSSTVTVRSQNTVSTVLKNLKKKKTYYVRVRSWRKISGNTYYSAWSTSAKAKITK